MERPKPRNPFVSKQQWKALRDELGRRCQLFIPIAGAHPLGLAIGEVASQPRWEIIDQRSCAQAFKLSLLRVCTIWKTLDRLATSARFGRSRIEFVQRNDSVYFVVECDADRIAHTAGWIRLWVKDDASDLWLKDAVFACVDVPTRQPLFVI